MKKVEKLAIHEFVGAAGTCTLNNRNSKVQSTAERLFQYNYPFWYMHENV